jgi:hypothetical protein
MKKGRFAFNAAALVTLVLACASVTRAQEARTFVAEWGRDTGSCSQFSPCRQITYALTQVSDGGEVNIEDNGTYRNFTITRPVTITTVPGVHALVYTVGDSAIRVQNAGTVVLHGLKIRGIMGDEIGIENFSPSDPAPHLSLHVEDCVMEHLDQGVAIRVKNTSLMVKDTTFRSRSGIIFQGDGDCFVNHSLFEDNSFGGISVIGGRKGERAVAVVRDSIIVHADFGFRVQAPGEGLAEITVENCAVTNSRIGVIIYGTSETVVRVSNSTITNNDYGFAGTEGGRIYSRGNNTVHGNRIIDSLITITTIPAT